MSVDVIMPQMGESIAEGTLVKWLKGIGDNVDRDEPLFEISTDKVDAEIPSPAAGVLLEILVPEGKTVEINTVVGRIGAAGEATRPATPKPAEAPTPSTPQMAAAPKPAPAPQPTTPAPPAPAAQPAPQAAPSFVRSSPVVQKIAAEHGIDVSLVEGTGEGGRVTKKDVMDYIASVGSAAPTITPPQPAAPSRPSAPTAPSPAAPAAAAPKAPAPKPAVFAAGQEELREPMSIMRKKIAEHMVMSKQTSPHVYTIFEVDMNEVVKRRDASKREFEAEGVKLTFLPYFIEACIRGIKEYPIINSSVDGETIIYKKTVNVGIAVALENGLIVPVIKHADQMNLLGLAKTAADLGERARTKRLMPDDVQGGTFTITNVGVFGGTFGLPIINQPQAAIMGIGTITKRPVVIDDAIAIRPIVYLSLSYDHRIIDGADAARFLTVVKRELEKPAGRSVGVAVHKSVCRAIDLGVVDYEEAFALQKAHVERLQHDQGDDVLLFVEHPHVITVGRNADGRAIVADHRLIEARGARVVPTDRGGDVTYHGPGQLVGYPIVRLEPGRRDIRRYVHDLEQVLIDTLADFGVGAARHPVHRGVWVGDRKIASLGIRISRWVTSHGFALNVSSDLSYFNLMNPCGIEGCRMTSLERECAARVSMPGVRAGVIVHFARVFARDMKEEAMFRVH